MEEQFRKILIDAAIEWCIFHPELEPKFSTACGMVFTDNSAADDFDIEMGSFAYSNNIVLEGKYVPFLYFEAKAELAKQQGGNL